MQFRQLRPESQDEPGKSVEEVTDVEILQASEKDWKAPEKPFSIEDVLIRGLGDVDDEDESGIDVSQSELEEEVADASVEHQGEMVEEEMPKHVVAAYQGDGERTSTIYNGQSQYESAKPSDFQNTSTVPEAENPSEDYDAGQAEVERFHNPGLSNSYASQ